MKCLLKVETWVFQVKKKRMTKAYIVEINSEVRSPVSVDAPHHEISLAAEVVAGKTIDRAVTPLFLLCFLFGTK